MIEVVEIYAVCGKNGYFKPHSTLSREKKSHSTVFHLTVWHDLNRDETVFFWQRVTVNQSSHIHIKRQITKREKELEGIIKF